VSVEFSLTPILDPAALEGEWRRREAQVGRSFFLSWAWIGTWLASLPAEETPLLLRAEADGETLALAVMHRRATERHRVFRAQGLYLTSSGDRTLDSIFIEHNGLLCEAAAEPALLAALAGWFARAEAESNELHLPGIEPALLDPAGLLPDCEERSGFAVDLSAVAAAGDIDGQLSRNARQQLRRAQRDYAASGELAVTEASSVEEALSFFAAMKKLHVASWQRRKRRHAFEAPYFEHFHRLLIERNFAAGAVQLLRLAAGGTAFGYLYNFCKDGIVSAYQSGFADGEAGLRPGVVSHALAIRYNAARGAQVYDFLAGDNRLKRSFATRRYTLVWLVLRRPTMLFRLEAAVQRVKRRLAG
jgi:CelD/BcsL family acetyltransferase involved in cellulose biosynthesis